MMDFKLGKQWIENREHVTDLIQRLFDDDEQSAKYLKKYEKGSVLLEEGDELRDIYILLDGSVELCKRKPDTDTNYPIIRLKPGSFIGIVAFITGEPSLTTSIVHEDATVLRIPDKDVRGLLKKNKRFQDYMDELILANLLERFRNTIILQMKLDSVNNKLREERNESQRAFRELKEAQEQLIYQEKMATLGQLVAGFAHEVNNPTASLLRSTETLEQRISDLMDRFKDDDDQDLLTKLYESGKKAGYPDTSTIREKSKELKKVFKKASPAQLRMMAQLPDELIEELSNARVTDPETLNFHLNHFELGKMFQNITSAGNRISGLVLSLKSYSRSDSDRQWEEIDIREGIHDTLQLTSNRIKYYQVDLDLPDVPRIRVNPAALNQVWTNIILNASDVMGKNGSLNIWCNYDETHLWVSIQDSGPGISEEIKEKIFDSNFSTKKSDKKFGLGLGLSISRDIVERHGGTISVNNSSKGGAVFTVRLPLYPELDT
ncbi:MAG: hypothetical protein EA360_02280 [Balneolaceae bacterium]|nr:MAG: hypothetical protein EA360_02280 [Balneolaceae bacterium]